MLLRIPTLALILLGTVAPLAAQPRDATFSLTRETISPLLADYFAPFSLRYPQSWILNTQAMESGSFFRVYTTARSGEFAGQISHQFSIGPLTVPYTGDDSTTMLLVMEEAQVFEARAFGEASQQQGTGFTTVDGIRAYELRNSGAGVLDAYTGTRVYGRFLFVPPTATSEGIMIGLTASGFNPEIRSAADVGTSGDLAAILRSVKIPRHPAIDPASMVRFTSSREKIVPQLQPWFLPFSVERPRSWELKAGPADPRAFAVVRRGVVRNNAPGFTTDLFAVHPLPLLWIADPAARESQMRATVDTIVQRIAEGWKSFKQTGRSRVTFQGRAAEEIRFTGTLASRNAEGVEYYGIYTIVEPTEKERGCVVVMQSCSLSPGITGPDDLGRKGELASVLRSFRFERRK